VKIFSTLKHIYVVIFILSVFVLLSIGLARTTGEEKKVSKVDDGYALLTSKDNSFDFKLTDKSILNTNIDFDKDTYMKNLGVKYVDTPKIKTMPVLTYHNTQYIPASRAGAAYYVEPPTFEKQMKYLYLWGYKTLTIDEYINIYDGKSKVYPYTVLLAFDDGNHNNYVYALPVMRKYGLTGVFNIIAGRRGLSITEIKDMATTFDIESHSQTHVDHSKVDVARLESEASASKNTLEAIIGKDIRTYTYPGCAYNGKAIDALKKFHYDMAFSCAGRHGINQETDRRFEVRRMHVDNDMNSLFTTLEGKLP
jgi:peptidoglycan/xylan/chitin deacetylase (PgdA/CDA1 family)